MGFNSPSDMESSIPPSSANFINMMEKQIRMGFIRKAREKNISFGAENVALPIYPKLRVLPSRRRGAVLVRARHLLTPLAPCCPSTPLSRSTASSASS